MCAVEPAALPSHLASAVIFVSCAQTLAAANLFVKSLMNRAGKVAWADRSSRQEEAMEFVVGLDSEWRPAFKKGESFKTSILQVAFPTAVLIFDLHWMFKSKRGHNDAMHAQQAILLLKGVLEAPALLKIGFAFAGDLDKLYKDYATATATVELVELSKDYATVELVEETSTSSTSTTPQPPRSTSSTRTTKANATATSQDKLYKGYATATATSQYPHLSPHTPASCPPLSTHSIHTHTAADCTFSRVEPFVDLQNEVMRGGGGGDTKKSLQTVVAERLGQRLVKTQRMSNWDARPLSDAQLRCLSLPL